MAKGKLPVTGFMEIQSGVDQWNILVRGLINELKTHAILTTQDSRTVKIGLLIISITPPQ